MFNRFAWSDYEDTVNKKLGQLTGWSPLDQSRSSVALQLWTVDLIVFCLYSVLKPGFGWGELFACFVFDLLFFLSLLLVLLFTDRSEMIRSFSYQLNSLSNRFDL